MSLNWCKDSTSLYRISGYAAKIQSRENAETGTKAVSRNKLYRLRRIFICFQGGAARRLG